MSCNRSASTEQKNFNGELAIHFAGLEGLDKPIVWVFPRLLVCLHCGFGEFVVPEQQKEQLKNGGATLSVVWVTIPKSGVNSRQEFTRAVSLHEKCVRISVPRGGPDE